MSDRDLRVALAQIEPGANQSDNLERLTTYVQSAARGGAGLIVFPEAIILSRDPAATRKNVAEPLDGPFVTTLARAARKHRIAVVLGTFEPADEAHVANTSVAIGPDGHILGSYRKIHLYDAFDWQESKVIQPGTGDLLTFQLGGFQIGVMTCYDVRFPETARALVDAGCEVILVPTSWVRGPLKEEHWDILMRARAIENTIYLLGAGMVGPKLTGGTMAVDPMGVVVARAAEEETLPFADLSHQRLRDVRSRLPVLQHRRYAVTFVPAEAATSV